MSGVDRSGNTGTRDIALPMSLATPSEAVAHVTAENAATDRLGRVVSISATQLQIRGHANSGTDLHWSVKGVRA